MQFWPFSLRLTRVILCVNFDWPKQFLSRTNLLPLTRQCFWTEGSVLNASFVRRITHEQRMVKSSGQGDQYPFGWRVFSAWDFLITERETAENKLASLTTAIKVWLSPQYESAGHVLFSSNIPLLLFSECWASLSDPPQVVTEPLNRAVLQHISWFSEQRDVTRLKKGPSIGKTIEKYIEWLSLFVAFAIEH